MTVEGETRVMETAPFVHRADDGTAQMALIVEGMHCASCVRQIENVLARSDGVVSARVNATTNRLRLVWDPAAADHRELMRRVEGLRFRLVPFNPEAVGAKPRDRSLVRALAVAGFGAGNIMMLSVAVWAGLIEDMGAGTITFLNGIAAAIVLPTVAYAGMPFFRSAVAALRSRTTNMDVPISVAVVLATAMSLFETFRGEPHVYFDAATILLFLLLIGRGLDSALRAKAYSATQNLLAMRGTSARLLEASGRIRETTVESIAVGDRVHVAAGERFPVDGRILEGKTDVDDSLISGETTPRSAGPGGQVYAGSQNLGAAVIVETSAVDQGTVLSEIAALMETAEQSRARYVRVADRMARLYVPVVHALAAAAFLVWFLGVGIAWQEALMIAVAVLIVTCPCALGLAVPAVQVGAVGRLFHRGILVKRGDALERLANADTVVFDKTGTLTLGRPALTNAAEIAEPDLRLAAGIAANSRHPLLRPGRDGAIGQGRGTAGRGSAAARQRGRGPPWQPCFHRRGRSLGSGAVGRTGTVAETPRTGADRVSLRRPPQARRRQRGPSSPEARQDRRAAFRGSPRRGRANGGGGRDRRLARRLPAGGKGGGPPRDGRRGPHRHDGLGRLERRPGARRRPCFAIAGKRGGNQPDGGRRRVSGRGPGADPGMPNRCRRERPAGEGKFRPCPGLQRHRRASGVLRLPHPIPRGLVHVRLVPRRDPELAAHPAFGGARMSALLYLIPVALFMGLLGLAAFLWSLRSGQYEDLDGAPHRILDDDERPPPPRLSGSARPHEGPTDKQDRAG